MRFKAALIALLPFVMWGCQTVEGTEVEGEAPAEISLAILTEKSAEAHQELEAVVSEALSVAKVTLATETLMGESTMSVQQAPRMGPDGNPIMGRIMKRPDTFTLHTNGKTCTLTHNESGNVYALLSVLCERAEP
jgi:hypothetical protein